MHTHIAQVLNGINTMQYNGGIFKYCRIHKNDFRTLLYYVLIKEGSNISQYNTKVDHILGSWRVHGPKESDVIKRYKEIDGYSSNNETSDITNSRLDQNIHHPSNYFLTRDDLSLSDNCPFALFEFIEQHPIIMNNIGMTNKLIRYWRYYII